MSFSVRSYREDLADHIPTQGRKTHMRRIVITWAAAAACALASAGTAAAAGTPQSATYLISCPGVTPFLAASPTPPYAAGPGRPWP
jgi:hypothetical protein